MLESKVQEGLCHELKTRNLLGANYSMPTLQKVVAFSKTSAPMDRTEVEEKEQDESKTSES